MAIQSKKPRSAGAAKRSEPTTPARRKTADDYYEAAERWAEELRTLRRLLLESGLAESLKWGSPCYSHNGKNVVGVGAFKSYFGLWFFQGALLSDDAGVLINAQQGKTKAQRQWRMHSARDIRPATVRGYVKAAIANVDSGREVRAERNKPLELPEELATALRQTKGATAAFRKLTTGKQREYATYIAEAKRENTRLTRAAKAIPMILSGGGLNDRYR
ncbi:MAG: DUF1801 domain-containing protein [Pseudomonadota bacterium]